MNKITERFERLHSPDCAALFIRIAVGVVFIYAGWFKIMNLEAVAGFFGMIGIPAFFAYVVAYVEFLGGIAALIGIGVRYAGILLAMVMLTAAFSVHLPNGFNVGNNGYEYVMVLFFGALALVTLGAGKYSLAALLRRRQG